MKATIALFAILTGRTLGQIEYVGNNGGTGFPLDLCQGGKSTPSQHYTNTSHRL